MSYKLGATADGALREFDPVGYPAEQSKVVEILGVRIAPLTMADCHALIGAAIGRGERVVISSQNLHGVYLYHRTEKMRALHSRSYPRVDGMSLVLLGRILGVPLRREHRVTWVDWIYPLMAEAAQRGWQVFYLGSTSEVVQRGAEILRQRFPGLQLVARDGHFDMTAGGRENEGVLAEIAEYEPHILMVGMGMPRQESWIYDNLDRLKTNAVLTCGAAIEYVAGAQATPPRWLGRIGLEWLYRLLREPRRLGRRYLIEPWYILRLLGVELWRRASRQPERKV
jgi:N-acetylglucosaminyldiphosphoundecaprenol N-acetyl-beta-D-mannosaminyltransferase